MPPPERRPGANQHVKKAENLGGLAQLATRGIRRKRRFRWKRGHSTCAGCGFKSLDPSFLTGTTASRHQGPRRAHSKDHHQAQDRTRGTLARIGTYQHSQIRAKPEDPVDTGKDGDKLAARRSNQPSQSKANGGEIDGETLRDYPHFPPYYRDRARRNPQPN